MKLYKMIINESQLKTIQLALESYTRLGIGQLEVVLSDLGFRQYEQFKDKVHEFHSRETEEAISNIKFKLFDLSFKASHSISNNKVNEDFKVCYDLYNVIKDKIRASNIDGKLTIKSDNAHKVSKNGVIQIELCTKEEEEEYARNKKQKD